MSLNVPKDKRSQWCFISRSWRLFNGPLLTTHLPFKWTSRNSETTFYIVLCWESCRNTPSYVSNGKSGSRNNFKYPSAGVNDRTIKNTDQDHAFLIQRITLIYLQLSFCLDLYNIGCHIVSLISLLISLVTLKLAWSLW